MLRPSEDVVVAVNPTEEPPEEDTELLPVDYMQCSLFYAVADTTTKVLLFDAASKVGRRMRRGIQGVLGRRRSFSARSVLEDETETGWKLWYARHRMLFVVTFLIITQISLMHQLLFSVEHRSCTSSSDCVRGTSCSAIRRQRREPNVCQACPPLTSKNETLRVQELCFNVFDSAAAIRAYDAEDIHPWPRVDFRNVRYRPNLPRGSTVYSPRIFVEFCSGCIDSDGTYKHEHLIIRETLKSMQFGDFVTLFVCAFAVGLAIIGELREIKVCNKAQRRCFAATKDHGFGHIWFALINAIRVYVLVPQVIAAVPEFVLLEGGNTVSLVFNTISVIFVTELDNVLTLYLLNPLTLAKVERHAQVVATRKDLRYLAVTQKVFVVGVIFVIFIGIFSEVHYLLGLSYYMAIIAVYIEGLAELLFYDSEQPLLTRIVLTLLHESWVADDCRLRRVVWCQLLQCHSPSQESPTGLGHQDSEDDDDDDDASPVVEPCWPHLMTVASRRRHRDTLCSRALLQDILTFTFELGSIVVLVNLALNVGLRTAVYRF